MRSIIFAAAFAALAGATAHAETLDFHATLNGASEVPPNMEKGSGTAMATLDTATKAFTYTVTYSGLSGPATAAHFHGPALPGANAGPTIPLANPTSPIKGTATLTDAQIADLRAGKWYVNVHSMAHPGGELRGQVMAGK
jgi:hypothetical protein